MWGCIQNFDWSNQDEPSFKELDVAKTEELAENDPDESGEVVQMQDESENGKGLRGGIRGWRQKFGFL